MGKDDDPTSQPTGRVVRLKTGAAVDQRASALRAKLRPPRPGRPIAIRARCVEQLLEASRAPLTLVSAPAGYGKTVALAQFYDRLDHDEKGVAWLSVDPRDKEPSRFFDHLLAAFEHLDPGTVQKVRPLLHGDRPAVGDEIITVLVNHFERRSKPAFLILDGFEAVAGAEGAAFVADLITHLPDALRLVISSRSRAPFDLGRLRVEGRISEIGFRDLEFTGGEIEDLFRIVTSDEVSKTDLSAETARADGWPTALGISASDRAGRRRGKAVTGRHPAIASYFEEVVFNAVDEDTREFMLATAPVDRLCASLADALTGRHEGRNVLEHLERAGLFLCPVDQDHRWFRYQGLFADFLRDQAGRLAPERVADLHLRASQWYQDNNFEVEAAIHAFEAGALDRAAELADECARTLIANGYIRDAVIWLEHLPPELADSRPRIGLYRAWALALSGRMDEADKIREQATAALDASRAENRVPANLDTTDLGTAQTLSFHAALLRDPWSVDLEALRRRCDEADREDPGNRGELKTALAMTLWRRGDFDAAFDLLDIARTYSKASGSWYAMMIAACCAATIERRRGNLAKALETAEVAVNEAADNIGQELPITAPAHLLRAEILYERNDIAGARRETEKAARHNRRISRPEWEARVLLLLALADLADGHSENAATGLGRIAELGGDHDLSHLTGAVAAAEVVCALTAGDMAGAEKVLKGQGIEIGRAGPGPSFSCDRWTLGLYLAYTRVLIARGRMDTALLWLKRLHRVADQLHEKRGALDAQVLNALVQFTEGNELDAQRTLRRALEQAEPEGYVRVFLDAGPKIADLLKSLGDIRPAGTEGPVGPSNSFMALVADGLAGRALAPGARASALSAQAADEDALLEPLTQREIEVLRLMAGGHTNRAIGEELLMSVGTAKWHVRNILAKLGVPNRVLAVTRGKELGLVN